MAGAGGRKRVGRGREVDFGGDVSRGRFFSLRERDWLPAGRTPAGPPWGALILAAPKRGPAGAALGGTRLACNQVLYHLRDRAIETDVLPHCERERMAVV